ncbi:MAG: formyltransferase family protein [Roseobacter sp.]
MTSDLGVTVHNPRRMRGYKVLFLGYDRQMTCLIDALLDALCEVHQTADKIPHGDYDLVVSFGYRHLIKAEMMDSLRCPVINLHISYLPFNKGAHPNFWSFYENTPAGVTIHKIDEGIDTGPILYQKRVHFAKTDVTFADTQKRLIEQVEQLFCDRLPEIIAHDWDLKPQVGTGTIHFKRDLPQDFRGWHSIIEDEITRLQKIAGTTDA